MCSTHHYQNSGSNGKTVHSYEYDLCTKSHHGKPCALNKEFNHPFGLTPEERQSPTYRYGVYPPTPPLSSHSGSSSDRSSRRSRAYLNGPEVFNVVESKRSRRHSHVEPVVYVESPPYPRSPPRQYTMPRGVPSSPSSGYIYEPPRYREDIVDNRDRVVTGPTINIEILKEEPHKHRHHRRSSSSKTSSPESSEGRRRRRDEDAERSLSKKVQFKIDHHNDDIANRPAVPQAPPLARSNTSANTSYRRGSVVIDRADAETIRMNQLNHDRRVEEERAKAQRRLERRAAEKAELYRRDEEAAQKQRLKDRMAPPPKRRNSIAVPQRIVYSDPLRWAP
ncbi:hypothetical protein F4778DRAFT_144031 [Xylariomycetidae sp. FL2044]|nr:hypothetical protein F4778DRAFT_144031 [Xylariomycetidae sp. FL2044]